MLKDATHALRRARFQLAAYVAFILRSRSVLYLLSLTGGAESLKLFAKAPDVPHLMPLRGVCSVKIKPLPPSKGHRGIRTLEQVFSNLRVNAMTQGVAVPLSCLFDGVVTRRTRALRASCYQLAPSAAEDSGEVAKRDAAALYPRSKAREKAAKNQAARVGHSA